MNEAGSIKIKITSDSDPVLRELQKVEQKAKTAFDKASAAADKTGERLAALQARMEEIERGKAEQLDIGLKWDPGAFDEAIQNALRLDAEYKRLSATVDQLWPKYDLEREKVEEASAAHEEAAQKVAEHEGGARRMNGVVSSARGLFASLSSRLGTLRRNTSKASKETKKHTYAMKQSTEAARPLEKSLRSVGRAIKSMLLYRAIGAVVNSVKEGFADLAKYSDNTQEALSRLTTSFLYIRNAVTVICKPVLEALAPAIETVADWFAHAANNAAQLATALFGNGTTYTKATKAAKEYGEETAAAAKKTDKAMATFDQINQLSVQEKESGTSPEDMFDEAPIEEKVVGLADQIEGFFEQLMENARRVWSVFQQSWEQLGQATVAAAKGALSGLLEVLGSIGRSFAEVWTNGTGLMLLNSIQIMLQNILGIIGAISDAFRIAWEQNDLGKTALNAIITAISKVISLATSIGQAFLKVWDESGLGVSIFSHILSIVGNVVTGIGNLAAGLQEAWEANGNGERIWAAILGIIDSILAGLDRMQQAWVNWTSGLNLEPLMSAFAGLLEAIWPVVDILMNGLAWAYENILLPLAGWVIEDAAPAAINVLTAAFHALKAILETVGPLFQALWTIVQPIASFLGGVLVAALQGLAAAIEVVGNAIAYVLELLGRIGGGLVSGISSVLGVGNAASAVSSSTMSAGYLQTASVPALATGAVIPPNNQFLAILGDQRHGTNIETPLSTMIDAFNTALDARGGAGGPVEVTVRVIADGKLARALKTELDNESRLRGVKLVTGGVY